jgi:hypothetical protein
VSGISPGRTCSSAVARSSCSASSFRPSRISASARAPAGRADGVMAGYWYRADATVDAFRKGSYDPIVGACLPLAGK